MTEDVRSIPLTIDAEADAAYARLSDAPVAATREVSPLVLVDLDERDAAVGIELLGSGTSMSLVDAYADRPVAKVARPESESDAALPDGSRPTDLVAQFHEVYELPNQTAAGARPDVDVDRVHMRMSLIKEEFAELCGAVYGPAAESVLSEALEQLPDEGSRDTVATADALADLVYVIYGMALETGIDLDAVLAEVQRSNLSKLLPDGSVKRRADGKVLKGPNFSEPRIAEVLFPGE